MQFMHLFCFYFLYFVFFFCEFISVCRYFIFVPSFRQVFDLYFHHFVFDVFVLCVAVLFGYVDHVFAKLFDFTFIHASHVFVRN